MVQVKDREEGANVGITKARLLMGTKAEWTPSPPSFQGHSCFGSEKLSVCVMDDGMDPCLPVSRKKTLPCYVFMNIIISSSHASVHVRKPPARISADCMWPLRWD